MSDRAPVRRPLLHEARLQRGGSLGAQERLHARRCVSCEGLNVQIVDGQVLLSPSDLTGHLACEHLTSLELLVARGEIARPDPGDDLKLLFAKGDEHEAAYLERLRADGLSVRDITAESRDFEAAAGDTREAMAEGPDVIYQAVFLDGRWRGRADFLLRVEAPSDLGAWSYEVLDTKLARSAKPAHILQLCFYTERLSREQGGQAEHFHVLLGSGERRSFRPQEFDAYARRVRRRLEEFVEKDGPTEAMPCEHCSSCDFLPRCEAWWEEVDHLSRVAGCGRRQIEKLRPAGIDTLRALARADAADPPPGLSAETFAKLHRQAALQLARADTGELRYELLEPEAARGFALLPGPSAGDIFFDLEGNPFWDEQGSLEYLWGFMDAEGTYTVLWAQDRSSEREGFVQLVDLIHERLRQHPDMHVYHYAAYEVSVLRRLAGRYGTRENEVDELLRRGVLVDLLKVVRGGLAASVPGYGLKEMEAFLDFKRSAEIRDGGTSVVEYERFVQTGDQTILAGIAAYNEEDCVATLALRDWLLARRDEALARFGPFPEPEPKEAKPLTPEKAERENLREELLHSGEEALELAAGLLHYHDRERKPVWWAFFERMELSPVELIEDSESIAVLTSIGQPEPDKRSLRHRFSYPAQEHKLGVGHRPFDRATGKDAGEIVELDRDARVLVLRRGPSLQDVLEPDALLPGEPYKTFAQEDALDRIANSLLARDGRYPAIESILGHDAFDHDVQTTDFEKIVKLLVSLKGQHLVIQGPPGSGKTRLSGELIARLLAEGKTVGAASTSHKAIHKLLEATENAGISVRGVKKATNGNPESFYEGGQQIESLDDRQACLGVPLTGGTAWLYSHSDFDGALDYLFIDEAGQVSLADALAMATTARNVILVGDPQQLAQVLQGSHPDGAGASVLAHLLEGHATIPPDRGLFLETTYRLRPEICDYISEEFYEGRLRSESVCATRTTPVGVGLRYCPVEHEGSRQGSEAEAKFIVEEIARIKARGVPHRDIMVVAAYNAQVNLLHAMLPHDVRVGTVDKFQGQETPVVFYSMASSSADDIPRGLEFLLSRNRLNVAISRAECLAYLVCSPRLLEVNCRTIDQMRLANALCRFVEISDGQALGSSHTGTIPWR